MYKLLHAGGPSGAGDLPGTDGKRRPQVRSRAVALSPTGQSWAAATTEGLLLYSLDQGATFDPTNLTEDIHPQVSSKALSWQIIYVWRITKTPLRRERVTLLPWDALREP